MSGVPEDVRVEIEKQLTGPMIERLALYASHKIKRMTWRGLFGGLLPQGMEPEDIVQEAVERVLNGRRKWDPKSQPNLYLHLRAIIDSLISNLTRHKENKELIIPSSAMAYSADEDSNEEDFFERVADKSPDTRQRLSAEEFYWKVHEFLSDEPDLQSLWECFLYKINKRSDIARHLNKTPKQITAMQRRLDNRLRRFRSMVFPGKTLGKGAEG